MIRNFKNLLTGKNKKSIYLDYAASTPVDPKVFEMMKPFFSQSFYNPSGIYLESVRVRAEVEKARKKISSTLKINSEEVVFTSGATESNQMVVSGAIEAARGFDIDKPEIVLAETEHASLLNFCKKKAKEGSCELKTLKVNREGLIDLKELRRLVNKNTVLISIHHTNNETGVIQSLPDIAREIRRFRKYNSTALPYFHSDLTQSPNQARLVIAKLGLDLATFGAQKNYGPKGVGFFIKKKYVVMLPTVPDGGQESGYRSGTENVPAIVGGAEAFLLVQEKASFEYERLLSLRSWFLSELVKIVSGVIVHQSFGTNQSPHIVSFTIPGINSELLVIELGERGVMCASRAACGVNDKEGSHVLRAMYRSEKEAEIILASGGVRFSFGYGTNKKSLECSLRALRAVLLKYGF